jgi:hypothetical protein
MGGPLVIVGVVRVISAQVVIATIPSGSPYRIRYNLRLEEAQQ